MKKVSIIIPVYNGSNYLSEAIDSALAQTYKNIEIIVVNDGSNDNGATEKIAKSYGKKIRYYKKENGGVASALNLGIKKMTGEYFSWLSHDDLYEKNKIEEQIKYLNIINSDNYIVACNSRVLFPNGMLKKEPINKNAFEYIDIFLATSANVGINGCSLLIPKKSLIKANGFNESLPVTQDYDLWFRLKDENKFVLLEKYLVIYRRHKQQDSVLKQQLCYEAGDKLHHAFLNSINYDRFKEFFSEKRENIKHIWDNYLLYKERGYYKTASMMLKLFLRYYFENDQDKFYNIYLLEIKSEKSNRKKISESDKININLEYEKLLRSKEIDNLIKKSFFNNKDFDQMKKIQGPLNRIKSSIKQDGLLLTFEKAIRKLISKIKCL